MSGVEYKVVTLDLASTSDTHVRQRGANVLCAMSGGVDSSVAAMRLKAQGFSVTGAMFRFWPDERAANSFALCCSPDAAYDARRVADSLDIPFHLFDARGQFAEVVVGPFAPTYQQGRTPNPCVWCNRDIKFGAFLRKARLLDCDYMATGHYVRRVDRGDDVELHRGKDGTKDQTYFLWALPAEALPHLLFPLGDDNKEAVRKEAEQHGLATYAKPSSHGLCFVDNGVKSYLQSHLELRPGPVVDASDGYREIGRHDGVQFYTIGQKKGLGLYKSHVERYVVELLPEVETVVVGTREMCHWTKLQVGRANYLLPVDQLPERVFVQTRYRQEAATATLREVAGESFELVLDEPMFAVAPGQSAVLYDGPRLLGGGVIEQRS